MDLQPILSPPELSVDYVFLKDEPFHLLFDMCVSGSNSSWNVHICVVDVNTQCKIIHYTNSNTSEETQLPFIRYALQVSPSPNGDGGSDTAGSRLQFPTFTFQCLNDTEENDLNIRNDALLHILQMFGWTQRQGTSPEEATKAFRGFIPMKMGGEVMMVYDYRILRQHYQPMTEVAQNIPRRMWGIVDEVVFERAVLGIPIASNVCDAIRDTPVLWNIWYKGREMDFPFSLLSVRHSVNEGEEWTNEKASPFMDDRIMKQQSLVKIGSATDAYTYGDDYGDLYLFSAKPLYDTAPGDLLSYQRYAVFTIDAKYKLDEKHHSAILAVREQLGGANIAEAILEADAPEGADIAEAILDADTPEGAEEGENDLPIVPCIYFVEDKLPHSMQLWGVREISRFCIL